MLKNPIFMREINQAARDPKITLLVLGFVAILGSILVLLWPRAGVFSLVQADSMQIFSIFLTSNLALIILLVPALTSSQITTERENNSFDMLFTSLLSPGEILRGKLFSGLAMVVAVVITGMPITALCALSGGVAPSLLFRAYAILFMAAITYGVVCLAVSAVCRATFTSLMVSYVLVATLAGSTWLIYYLGGRLDRLRWLWLALRALSPFDAMFALVYPTRYEMTQISQLGDNPYLPFYLHLLGMTVILLVALVFFCRYVLSPPSPGVIYAWLGGLLCVLLVVAVAIEFSLYQKAVSSLDPRTGMIDPRSGIPDWMTPTTLMLAAVAFDALGVLMIRGAFLKARSAREVYEEHYEDRKTAVRRRLRWPFYLIDPLRRKNSIGRWRNPVYVAEMRSKIFGRPKFIIRGLATCLIANMVLMVIVCWQYASTLEAETVRMAAIVFQFGIVAVLAPAISSGSITDERTSRTFTMLRMTPLPALTLVLGKLRAAFLYVSIFLISSLPVLLALCFLEYDQDLTWAASLTAFSRVFIWVAIMLMATIAFVTAGLCASAFAKSTSGATAISYTVAALLCIVTLAGLIPGAMGPGMANGLLTANPIVAALYVTSNEMFPQLPARVWLYNLIFLAALSGVFILASSVRVYQLFTRRD